MLALALALPPFIIVSILGLSSLQSARDAAVQIGTTALREAAETQLANSAADRARFYNARLEGIDQQVHAAAAYARALIQSGPPAPVLREPVWVAPNGPDLAAEAAFPVAVARARSFLPMLRELVASNPLVSLGYIALEEGGVMATDKDIIEILRGLSPFDPRTRSWYLAARQTERTVWVDTYVDANTGELVTTCATPLYDSNGVMIGVVGFDVLLTTIQQDILALDMGSSGYAFLMNQDGAVLVRPDMVAAGVAWNQPFVAENLRTSDDPQLRGAVDAMIAGRSGVTLLERSDVYLAYAPISTAGWSVGIVTPRSEVFARLNAVGAAIDANQRALQQQVLIIVVLGLIAVPLLGVLLSMMLTRPLRELQTGTQRIADGDLHYRMESGSNDEIGDLTQAFNNMAESLSTQVEELERNVRRMAMLNEVSNQFKGMLDLQTLLDAITRALCERFGFDRAVLYLLEGRTLRAASASFGPTAHDAIEAHHFLTMLNAAPISLDSDSIEADIVRGRQAVIVDKPWHRGSAIRSWQEISRGESYVQAPIIGRNDHVIGILSADYATSGRPVTARDAAQVLTFANMVGLSIENTHLYAELEQLVHQRTSELRHALDRAHEADRLKGQFLASISHELRTPLNAIIGFSTVLLDELDGPISAYQREDLTTINRNGRYLLHMINDLLDLARIDAGRLELEHKPIDLRLVIEEAVETARGLLLDHELDLRIGPIPELPPLIGDSSKIRQVLLNLVSNAIKFTDRGEVTISVRVQSTSPTGPEEVLVSVRDTGIGIPANDLARIFDEFYQSDMQATHQRRRGSGLGLTISRKLIEAHGGRIMAESVVGQGSIFSFTMPSIAQPTAEVAMPNDQTIMERS